MKTLYLFLTIGIFSNSLTLFGQTDTSAHPSGTMFYLESMPEFNNSSNGLIKFIESHLQYPADLKSDSIEGIVYVEFWVDTTGQTYDHKVLRGLNKKMNEEAIRVAKMITFSKPAMQRGKPVNVKYVVPIKFDLLKAKDGSKCKNKNIQRFDSPLPDKLPIFNGKLNESLKKRFIHFYNKKIDSINGTIYISFKVDTNGETFNHKILKGINNDLNSAALKAIEGLEFKEPAKVRNKPVQYRYLISIKLDKKGIKVITPEK